MAAEIATLLEKQNIDKDQESFSPEPLSLAPSSSVMRLRPPEISAEDKIVKYYLSKREPLFNELDDIRAKLSIPRT